MAIALSQTQLDDLIDSIVKKNNRNLIDGPKLNRVLHEIVAACFNTGGTNMANTELDIQGSFLHNGNANSWGITNLQQLYFSTSIPPGFGPSIKLQGYGVGADNPLFQVLNSANASAISTTGNLRTTFGGNIGIGITPTYAKVNASTNVPGEYGGYFVSQFNIGVSGISETGAGVQGQSEVDFGVYGSSASGVGVRATSNTGYGLYANSYNSIAFQAISSNNIAGVIQGNSPFRALQVNNVYVGAGTAVEGNALNGNVGVWGNGGNYGVVGYGTNGGLFAALGIGWGLLAEQSVGTGALKTTGKVVHETLATTPSLANEVFIYDDGTRKYLCIN